ncbi:MAG TPA: biotin/lipoyl-binding protein, partial [Acidimicrobiales bacterium]|nr:biotin/lipoyl-binding protein [Acidimicrobiales bacterium]
MTLAPEEQDVPKPGTATAPVDWETGAFNPDLNGAPPSSPQPSRRRRRRWRAPVAIVVVVALAGGGTAYYFLSRSSGAGGYRTFTAALGDIREEEATTGTIEPANQADVNFGVAGTVAKVLVAQGATVKAGQVIATLVTANLDAAVQQA